MIVKYRKYWWAIKFRTKGWNANGIYQAPALYRTKSDAEHYAKTCFGARVIKVRIQELS